MLLFFACYVSCGRLAGHCEEEHRAVKCFRKNDQRKSKLNNTLLIFWTKQLPLKIYAVLNYNTAAHGRHFHRNAVKGAELKMRMNSFLTLRSVDQQPETAEPTFAL